MSFTTFLNARLVGQPQCQTFTVQVDTSTGLISSIVSSKLSTQPPQPPKGAGAVYDLLGTQYLAPSLIDNHVHFSMWALASRRLDLMDCTSASQVFARVRRWLSRPHNEVWLVGQRMRVGGWRDIDILNRASLDALEMERPLVLFFAGFHSLVANSAALRKLRYEPEGHSGILLERECFEASVDIGELSDEVLDALMDTAAQEAA